VLLGNTEPIPDPVPGLALALAPVPKVELSPGLSLKAVVWAAAIVPLLKRLELLEPEGVAPDRLPMGVIRELGVDVVAPGVRVVLLAIEPLELLAVLLAILLAGSRSLRLVPLLAVLPLVVEVSSEFTAIGVLVCPVLPAVGLPEILRPAVFPEMLLPDVLPEILLPEVLLPDVLPEILLLPVLPTVLLAAVLLPDVLPAVLLPGVLPEALLPEVLPVVRLLDVLPEILLLAVLPGVLLAAVLLAEVLPDVLLPDVLPGVRLPDVLPEILLLAVLPGVLLAAVLLPEGLLPEVLPGVLLAEVLPLDGLPAVLPLESGPVDSSGVISVAIASSLMAGDEIPLPRTPVPGPFREDVPRSRA